VDHYCTRQLCKFELAVYRAKEYKKEGRINERKSLATSEFNAIIKPGTSVFLLRSIFSISTVCDNTSSRSVLNFLLLLTSKLVLACIPSCLQHVLSHVSPHCACAHIQLASVSLKGMAYNAWLERPTVQYLIASSATEPQKYPSYSSFQRFSLASTLKHENQPVSLSTYLFINVNFNILLQFLCSRLRGLFPLDFVTKFPLISNLSCVYCMSASRLHWPHCRNSSYVQTCGDGNKCFCLIFVTPEPWFPVVMHSLDDEPFSIETNVSVALWAWT
jgi:hypothetical protein